MRDGATHYTAASGIREVREKTAAYVTRHTGVPTRIREHRADPGLEEPPALRAALAGGGGRRGDRPRSRVPDLPIARRVHRRQGGLAAAAPGERLPRRRRRAGAGSSPRARGCWSSTRRRTPPAASSPGTIARRSRALAIEHDLIVLSDEIYNRLSYDGEHVSLYGIDGMAERTIYMDGLSKAWAMCGWRLGFGVDAGRDRQEDGHADDQQLVVRRGVHAVGRRGGLRFAGVGRRRATAWSPSSSHRRDRIVELLNAHPRVRVPPPGRRVLRLPRHHRDRLRRSRACEARCSTRSGSRCSPGSPSDPRARATSASATRRRSTTSRRRRDGSRSTSARRLPDDPSMAYSR